MENKSQKSSDKSFSISCLKTIPSTNFMKILLLHIIENTLLVINNIIAIFIVINYDSSEKSFYYGLALLNLPFMINLLILLNECYYKTDLVETCGRYKWMKCILIITLLPNIPFSLFLITLCGFDINKNYQQRIMHASLMFKIINASLNNVTLIFLLIRGVITINSETCFVDELGRSACILYPVIISIIVGYFVIMTNVLKLTSIRYYLVPILLIVTCYRTIGISLIITYFDYWSIIPLLIIFSLNILAETYREDENKEIDNDEIDAATGLVWDGDEWVGLQTSTNIMDKEKNVKRDIEQSSNKVNIIIKNLLNSFTPVYSDVSLITDISILVVLSVLYYLININENFNYEETILKNHNFNLTIMLISNAGIISFTFHVSKYFKQFCSKVISIVSICTLFLILTLTIIISFVGVHQKNLSFFIIEKNNNTNDVFFLHLPIDDQHNFDKLDIFMSFDKNQIIFDSNVIPSKHDLVFCSQWKFCKRENARIVLYYQGTNQNLRSSSPVKLPSANIIYLNRDFKIEHIHKLINKSETLFLTKSFPDNKMLLNALSCTHDKNIFIDNHDKIVKCDTKYLFHGKIYQNICLRINNVLQTITIKCKTVENNFELLKNVSHSLSQREIKFSNGFSNSYCCLNETHSLTFYGSCNTKSLIKGINLNFKEFIRNRICSTRLLQYSSFADYTNDCLFQISYFTRCYEDVVNADCGYQTFSCDKIL